MNMSSLGSYCVCVQSMFWVQVKVQLCYGASHLTDTHSILFDNVGKNTTTKYIFGYNWRLLFRPLFTSDTCSMRE